MHFLGDNIAAGRPSNWEQARRPSFAGNSIVLAYDSI